MKSSNGLATSSRCHAVGSGSQNPLLNLKAFTSNVGTWQWKQPIWPSNKKCNHCRPTECHQQMFEIRIDVSVNRLFCTHDTNKKRGLTGQKVQNNHRRACKLVQNQRSKTWIKQGALPLWTSNVQTNLADSWIFHVGFLVYGCTPKMLKPRSLNLRHPSPLSSIFDDSFFWVLLCLMFCCWQYCWWKTSCTSWEVVYPIICRVSYIPGG